MKKSTLVIAAVSMMAAMFTSCTKKSATKKSADKIPTIGIIQLVEHVALDANCKGFIDGLAEEGFIDKQTVNIDFQNAQGEQANCVTIAQKFVNNRADLIFAIATPAAQAAANLTKKIPIVVSSVTDPESAKLVKSNSMPGTNVTGTSDLTPCAAQINLLKTLVPDVKNVGMLYCSNEQNSYFQIALAKAECDKLGISYTDYTVSSTNEIQQVVQSAVGKVDAIYSPTDNMIASAMINVSQVTTPAKIPVIVGEEGMCANGGLATYGLNYYELGKQTAKMAAKILRGESEPKDMPIEYLSTCNLTINEEVAKAIGITIPEELK